MPYDTITPAGTEGAIAPDADIMRRYVEAIFKHASAGSYVALRGYPPIKNNPPIFNESVLVDDRAAVLSVALRGATETFGASGVFCPPPCTFTRPGTAQAADIADGLTLSVDLDAGDPDAGRTLLESLIGPATVIVASGGTILDPDTLETRDKLHLHWRLSVPTRDTDGHRRLQRPRLAAAMLTGADICAARPAQPLRWPGSIHTKDNSAPRIVRIVAETDHEIELDVALAVLIDAARAHGIDLPDIAPRATKTTVRVDIPYDTDDAIRRATETARRHEAATGPAGNLPGTWHPESFKLGAALCRNGVSLETAIDLAERHWKSRGTGFKSQDRFVYGITSGYETADSDGEFGFDTDEGRRQTQGSPEDAFGRVEGFKTNQHEQHEQDHTADQAPPKKRRLRILSVDDAANVAQPRYLIKELLARGDMVEVIGAPSAGKSVLAPFIGWKLAQGNSIFGRRVRQSRVLYIAAEDPFRIRQRFAALKRKYGDAPDFRYMVDVTNLFDSDGDIGELLELVRECKPDLIIIDTRDAAFPGLEETKGESMAILINRLRALAAKDSDDPGPCCMVIDHNPLNGAERPSGHHSLLAALDVTLIVKKDEGAPLVHVKIGKNRNGEGGKHLVDFRIASESLGIDDDGDAMTAPIYTDIVPNTAEEIFARHEDTKAIFLRLVKDNRDGVSREPKSKNYYAPRVFADGAGNEGRTEAEFKEAMDALFQAKQLAETTVKAKGRKSRQVITCAVLGDVRIEPEGSSAPAAEAAQDVTERALSVLWQMYRDGDVKTPQASTKPPKGVTLPDERCVLLQDYFQGCEDAMLSASLDGRMQYSVANRALKELVERNEVRKTGQYLWLLNPVPPLH